MIKKTKVTIIEDVSIKLDLRTRELLKTLSRDLGQKPGIVLGAALLEYYETTLPRERKLSSRNYATQVMVDICDAAAGREILPRDSK